MGRTGGGCFHCSVWLKSSPFCPWLARSLVFQCDGWWLGDPCQDFSISVCTSSSLENHEPTADILNFCLHLWKVNLYIRTRERREVLSLCFLIPEPTCTGVGQGCGIMYLCELATTFHFIDFPLNDFVPGTCYTNKEKSWRILLGPVPCIATHTWARGYPPSKEFPVGIKSHSGAILAFFLFLLMYIPWIKQCKKLNLQ